MNNMHKTNNVIQFSFIMVMIIVMLSFSSAMLGTFKQNEPVDIRVLANCSSINLTEVNDGETTYVINSPMTNLGGQTFNYSFPNTSAIGTYSYSWNNPCVDCASNECGNSFQVTMSGAEPAGDITIVVFSLLFIVILFLSIIYLLKILGHSLELTVDLIDVGIMVGAYLSIFVFYYISHLYLGNPVLDDLLLLSLKVGAVTHVFLPLVAFILSFIMVNLQFKQKAKYTY
jgi:hypothetical protein